MKKNLKNLFSEDVQSVLTEDTLNAIEEAFNNKVDLAVEQALVEQDDVYAEMLETLLEKLDKDRTKKLKILVESIDKKNASDLVKIVRLYERANSTDANKFKKHMITTVSAYLDEFLSESFDKKDFSQAVKNNTAFNVLSNLRKVLAVDSTVIKESFKDAIVDGQKQLEDLKKENAALKKQYSTLLEDNQKAQVAVLLEQKTSKLPETKKQFVKKMMEGKSLEFIKENFDYTLRLFEKQEQKKLDTLKEDALKQRKVQPDVVPVKKVIEEKVNKTDDLNSQYLEALSRSKGTK